ncbi:uncharacterized protein DS421_4g114670 [Arachis hypogaea]|nr:uncharacterized protein DS421_4g114670 [Arachis hypogaea]
MHPQPHLSSHGTHCLPQYPQRRKKQTNEGEGRTASLIWFVEPSPLLVGAIQGRREDAHAQGGRSRLARCRRAARDRQTLRATTVLAPPDYRTRGALPSEATAAQPAAVEVISCRVWLPEKLLLPPNHRRSFWLLLPSLKKFVVDPLELLAIIGVVARAGSKSQLLCFVIPINPEKEAWNLKVRVIRLWTVPTFTSQLLPNSMEMILVDESGCKIQATIRKTMIYRLIHDTNLVSTMQDPSFDASYLLNKTCVQLFEQHLKDVDVVFGTQSPPIFQEIVGKTMLFKVLSRPVGMEKFKGTYPVRRVCDDAAILGMFELSGSDLSPEKAGFVLKGDGSFGEPSKVTESPNLGLTPSSCSELFAGSPQFTQPESSVVDLGADEDAKCPLLKRKSADAVVDKLNEVDSSENSSDEVDESEEEYVAGVNRGSVDAKKDVKPSLKRLRRSLRLQFDEADESRGSGNDGSSGHGVN